MWFFLFTLKNLHKLISLKTFFYYTCKKYLQTTGFHLNRFWTIFWFLPFILKHLLVHAFYPKPHSASSVPSCLLSITFSLILPSILSYLLDLALYPLLSPWYCLLSLPISLILPSILNYLLDLDLCVFHQSPWSWFLFSCLLYKLLYLWDLASHLYTMYVKTYLSAVCFRSKPVIIHWKSLIVNTSKGI